jgi:hypothetical protein
VRPLVTQLVVELIYTVTDRLLRPRLGDELAAKWVLQIVSASALSVSTTLGLIALWRDNTGSGVFYAETAVICGSE